jgi:hypothetical protein
MRAIIYLYLTIIKNKILYLRKKPAYLLLYGIILLSVVGIIISSAFTKKEILVGTSYSDIRILYGIIAGLASLFLYSFISTGLSTGSTLFSMEDVGILFPSPISSKKILIYGLVKQMGTTLFSAFFILYQGYNLKKHFGLGYSSLFNIVLIYAILLFWFQLLSISIYIFSNGNPARKNIVKGFAVGFLGIILLFFYISYLKNDGIIVDSILGLMDFLPFQFLPAIGWSVMFFNAFIQGKVIFIAISMLLFLLTTVLMISLFTNGDADYYEDVLNGTIFLNERTEAAKNGKTVFKKVKVKGSKTGLKNGKGSSAIFYKNVLEKSRSSRFIFVDFYTVFATVGSGFAAKMIHSPDFLYIILGVLIYVQFFMATMGSLSKELKLHYIYLIPEKSIKKIFSASITSMIKPFADAIFIFTAVGIFSETSFLLNLFLGLAYGFSGAIFVSYFVLLRRIFGGTPNKIVSSIVGIVLLLIILSPGIGTSVVAVMMLPPTLTFLGTLPFTLCCALITLIVFLLCGNLLDKSEFGNG